MRLPVVTEARPWYADGLNFTCSQCGNCCTGGPGYVYISREEIVRVSEFLKITPEEVVEKYCRKVGGEFSLTEKRRGDLYDCVFLVEQKKPGQIAQRVCSIYPVRPLQCRTWPFWPENLRTKSNWDTAAKRCHGMNHGNRKFSLPQIESLRDAKDWPQNPPTSAASKASAKLR